MDRFGVILVGAGSGERFGKPKAFVDLDGATLLDRSAAAFATIPHRVAVLRPMDCWSMDGWTVVAGGERRRDSVAHGLAALPAEVEFVLIHDVARPLVPADLIQRVMDACANHAAVIPAVAVTDTIKRVQSSLVQGTLDRSELVSVQTPQAFRRDVLERALAASPNDATDEASLVESLGEPVHVVEGSPKNLKITHPADLALATAYLQLSSSRRP